MKKITVPEEEKRINVFHSQNIGVGKKGQAVLTGSSAPMWKSTPIDSFVTFRTAMASCNIGDISGYRIGSQVTHLADIYAYLVSKCGVNFHLRVF